MQSFVLKNDAGGPSIVRPSFPGRLSPSSDATGTGAKMAGCGITV